jgi:hypothetical protein
MQFALVPMKSGLMLVMKLQKQQVESLGWMCDF